MSRQTWQESVAWATADGTAIATSTTETIVFPDVVIPGFFMADGRMLRLTAFGRLSTTGTPTLIFRIRWGGVAGTVLAASGLLVTGSAVVNAMWRVEAYLQTRSNGASGSIFAVGVAEIGDDATATVGSATNVHGCDFMGSAGVAVPAAVTADLTVDKNLSLTAQWGTSSASNTLTGHVYVVEAMN